MKIKNKFNFFRNRKASALPVEMVVIIVLAIIGLAIALWFLYGQLKWEGMVDRQVCHQSVVLRGSTWDEWHSSGKELIPLKCKTRNICVTQDKKDVDECEKLWQEEFDTFIVSENEAKQKQEIMNLFADEMYECWKMMGQGRVKLFSREILKEKSRAVICSRIKFENNIKVDRLSKFWDMAQYLFLHRPAGEAELSYWEYLINANQGEVLLTKNIDNSENLFINLSEIQTVVFAEHSNSRLPWLTGAASGAVFGGALGSAVPLVGTGIGIVGGGIAGFIGVGNIAEQIDQRDSDFYKRGEIYSEIFIAEYSADEFERLGIDELESI